MDLGSFVISSTSIESLIVFFQRTGNDKYNAFDTSVRDDVTFGGDISTEGTKSATHLLISRCGR